jgi:hypothetical protein
LASAPTLTSITAATETFATPLLLRVAASASFSHPDRPAFKISAIDFRDRVGRFSLS